MSAGADGRTSYQCDCGARVKAPAEAAGRKARCPRCGTVFVLRASATAPTPAEAAPSPADVIRFACSCGARLAVPAQHAGRRVKCRKCAAAVVVPAPESGRVDADDLLGSLADDLSQGQAVDAPRPAMPTLPPVSSGDGHYGLAPAVPKARYRDEEADVNAGPPQQCRSCGKMYPGGAKICVECGINLKNGRPVLMTDESHIDQAYTYAEGLITWLSFVFPFGMYPIASEAFGVRKPWVIRGVAVLTIIVSAWYLGAYIYPTNPDAALGKLMLWGGRSVAEVNDLSPEVVREMRADGMSDEDIRQVLQEFSQSRSQYHGYQLLTHALLHGGIMHLAGNLLFLMVFGSRVNALIGNILTALLYPLLAVAAAVAHLISVAHEPLQPMLGASGAIMGLAGMYFVLFPVHKVHMAAWYRWRIFTECHLKLFAVRGFWVVLFYIAFDVVFTALKLEDGTAHWAHLGGFIAGMIVAFALLFSRLINARGGDILTAILGRHAWTLIGRPNRPAITLW